ncbi:MAG: hypothetical protein ACK5QS_04560 [Pseudanabaenaceae cyanobacterium]
MKLLQRWSSFWFNLLRTQLLGNKSLRNRSQSRQFSFSALVKPWGIIALVLLLLIPTFNLSAFSLSTKNTDPVNQTIAQAPSQPISQPGSESESQSGSQPISQPAARPKFFTPVLDPFLTSGKLADGEAKFTTYLTQFPQDDKARFSLGVVQLLRGVERLSQSFYRYGLRRVGNGMGLPFVRLPIPNNPKPEAIGYPQLRQVFQQWNDDLATSAKTLEPIRDPQVKLAIRWGMVRLDLDGDGKYQDEELLWRVFQRVSSMRLTQAQANNFLVAFDLGDVYWLRGYTHLLRSLNEFILAYNTQDTFDRGAHLFFQQTKTPHNFLLTRDFTPEYTDYEGKKYPPEERDNFLDWIAVTHSLQFPLAEPMRLTAVWQHLQEVTRLSQLSWQAINAETDNDREWLPNPRQASVIPNAKVTDEMIQTWTGAMQEFDRILKGERLIPFWRNTQGVGINAKRVFTEPQAFDLFYWIQGTAATPYLEKGRFTSENIWGDLFGAFGSDLLAFGIWFN